ncbi:hypothetical protein ACKKBF_B04915 [Auxenochlorella protothecoides x Auxenochlorella symbiontica]
MSGGGTGPCPSSHAYVGDITALCAVHATPYLLVASGSTVRVLHMYNGAGISSCIAVPDAIRVQGLRVCPFAVPGADRVVLAHGDRLASLLSLDTQSGCMSLIVTLPRLRHWILAASLWAASPATLHIVLGLANNSLTCFTCSPERDWRPDLAWQVDGQERSLLYSMAIQLDWDREGFGGASDGTRPAPNQSTKAPPRVWVAGGTIFLDVVVWEARPGSNPAGPTRLRLKGHEGSIHRVCWAPCGAQLASASDDRTLRIWDVSGLVRGLSGACEDVAPRLALYGHAARLWDACFVPGVPALVSVAEDCTARLWGLEDGASLGIIRGHTGRGIWQCAAACEGKVLITGGADGAVHSWLLSDWVHGPRSASWKARHADGPPRQETEVCRLPDPGTSDPGSAWAAPADATPTGPGVADSRGEYVRCLAPAGGGALVVATNRGRVWALLDAAGPGSEWRQLWASPRVSPPIHLQAACSGGLLALTELSGRVVVLRRDGACLRADSGPAQACVLADWAPGPDDAPALGAFWGPALDAGRRCLFTTDAGGVTVAWAIPVLAATPPPACLARLASPFRQRVTALGSATAQRGAAGSLLTVVAGDKDGAGVAWEVPLGEDRPCEPAPLAARRHLHAGGPMRIARVLPGGRVLTAGNDGCAREWAMGEGGLHVLRRGAGVMEGAGPVVGTEALGVGSTIECVPAAMQGPTGGSTAKDPETAWPCDAPGPGQRLAAGFQMDEFVVRDADAGVEVARIPCGGWRRPCCFWAESADRMDFMHASGRQITRQRRRPGAARPLRTLRAAWHGMEANAVRLVAERAVGGAARRLRCITAGEDGALRTLDFGPGDGANAEPFCGPSARSVDGAAVRALALAPRANLLLAGGAKEALAAWRLAGNAFEAAAPPPAARRPHRARDGAAALLRADLRILSLCTLETPGLALALAALADGSLRALALATGGDNPRAPRHVADLAGGGGVALCCAGLAPPDAGVRVVAAGASDGSLAFWDLSSLARDLAARGGAADGAEESAALVTLAPALRLEGVHQSGVNSVSLVWLEDLGQLLALTGGDDQALHLQALRPPGAPPGPGPRWRAAGALRVPNAHGSAVRGVWTDGGVGVSVGLDQRLRTWALDWGRGGAAGRGGRAGGAGVHGHAGSGGRPGRGGMPLGRTPMLCALGSVPTQVLEPAALDVLGLGAGELAVAVAGRGLELLTWRPA